MNQVVYSDISSITVSNAYTSRRLTSDTDSNHNEINHDINSIITTENINYWKSSFRSVSNSLFHVDAASNSAITTTYTVTATIPGQTFQSLSSQLNASVVTGVFNTLITQYAQVNNAYGFINATSNSVTTVELDDNDSDNNNGISGGLLIGLIILGIVIGGIIILYLYYVLSSKYCKKVDENDVIIENDLNFVLTESSNPVLNKF